MDLVVSYSPLNRRFSILHCYYQLRNMLNNNNIKLPSLTFTVDNERNAFRRFLFDSERTSQF